MRLLEPGYYRSHLEYKHLQVVTRLQLHHGTTMSTDLKTHAPQEGSLYLEIWTSLDHFVLDQEQD